MINFHPRGFCSRGGILQYAQTFFLRHARLDAAEDAHGVTLLKAIQRTRRGAGFNVRERGHRHEFAIARLDFQIEQRSNRRAVFIADLRNDFVAAIKVIEPIHIRTAQHRAEFLTRRREIEPEIGEPFAIQHHAGLRLIDLQVGVHVKKLAALPARADDGLREFEQLLHGQIALQHEFDVVLTGRRQRRIEAREDAQSGHLRHRAVHFAVHFFGRAFAIFPILRHHTAKAAPMRRERPHELRFGKRLDDAHGVERLLMRRCERGIRRGFHEEADVALIFHGREFAARMRIKRPRGNHHQQRRNHHRPTHCQRAVEQLRINSAHPVEAAIHQRSQFAFLAMRMHKARTHHRRQRDGHESREYHRCRERDGEFEE